METRSSFRPYGEKVVAQGSSEQGNDGGELSERAWVCGGELGCWELRSAGAEELGASSNGGVRKEQRRARRMGECKGFSPSPAPSIYTRSATNGARIFRAHDPYGQRKSRARSWGQSTPLTRTRLVTARRGAVNPIGSGSIRIRVGTDIPLLIACQLYCPMGRCATLKDAPAALRALSSHYLSRAWSISDRWH